MPHAREHPDLESYLAQGPATGDWGDARAYVVSLLKAWWGEHATAGNDFCFDHLPRLTGTHSAYDAALAMLDGGMNGYFLLGENPAVGSAASRLHRLALAKLDWLVVRDLVEVESASFWYEGPEVESGELRQEDIATEVFLMPAASHVEKDGSFTNTQRLLQWRTQAVEPPGDCRSELWFAYRLGRLVRERLAGSTEPRDRPILDLVWDYGGEEPSAEAVLREINGFDADGRMLDGFHELRDDGSTACGCWLYSGCFAGGVNRAALRTPRSEQGWIAPEWGWAWPANRRILHNRASADPDGRPWSERKRLLWWDDDAEAWAGSDLPDFAATKPPSYEPPEGARAGDGIGGARPFVMQPDGRGSLFVPSGLLDGPLPAHYEPQESPFENPLYPQRANPARRRLPRPENPSNPAGGEPGSERYPYVMTTYRLTEHHAAGGMSRTVAYLSELQPEMFCEVSPELAAERGLENGGWATIVTSRTAIEARVLVTERISPLEVQGRRLHQVGLPYHWGSRGLTTGGSANDLFSIALDPNVQIQEVKAASCDIRPGRLPEGREVRELVDGYPRRENA
jgi:formate dehydrogenase major subunit